MDKIPDEITVCNLEVIVMPNGEILSCGISLGFFNDFKIYLKEKNDGK